MPNKTPPWAIRFKVFSERGIQKGGWPSPATNPAASVRLKFTVFKVFSSFRIANAIASK
jgi:hypothetical protein